MFQVLELLPLPYQIVVMIALVVAGVTFMGAAIAGQRHVVAFLFNPKRLDADSPVALLVLGVMTLAFGMVFAGVHSYRARTHPVSLDSFRVARTLSGTYIVNPGRVGSTLIGDDHVNCSAHLDGGMRCFFPLASGSPIKAEIASVETAVGPVNLVMSAESNGVVLLRKSAEERLAEWKDRSAPSPLSYAWSGFMVSFILLALFVVRWGDADED